MRVYLKIVIWALACLALFVLASNLWIMWSTYPNLKKDVSDLDSIEVALVLGTSKSQVNGKANPYFINRIRKAAELYHAGKIKHLLVSGDNHSKFYNEPLDMQKALIALGVSKADITLDYAGFRTLDSIVRCKEIFGQREVVIITQKFHAFRALFISKYYNLNAQALVADALPLPKTVNMELREVFARPKAVLDLYVLNITPKYMGKKEQLGFVHR